MTAQADALMGIFGLKRVEEKEMGKVSETRRALFELSMRAKLKVEGYSGFSLDSMLDRDGVRYSSVRIAGAWEGFNAALDAVVIELPKERAKREGFQHETLEDSAFNDCRYLCVDAIESTNLGLRIK